jgi:hypothetical protein
MTAVPNIIDDDELFSKRVNEVPEVQANKNAVDKTVAVKPAKEPWSNLGAAVADRFVVDDPEYITRHRAAIGFQKKLGSKQFATINVFGFEYPADDLNEEYLREMSSDFIAEIVSGNICETVTVFKNMPAEIQMPVLGFIVDGFSQYDGNLNIFFNRVVEENNLKGVQLDDLRGRPGLKALNTVLKGIQDNVDRLKTIGDSLVQLTAQAFGKRAAVGLAGKVLAGLPEEYAVAYEQVNQLLSYSEQRIGKIGKEFSEHKITLEEIGAELSLIVVILDKSMNDYQQKLQAVNVQSFAQALKSDQDQVTGQVATVVRSIYEKSEGAQVVTLSPEAYAVVNNSLRRLGQRMLPLTIFCDKDPVILKDVTDLLFITKASYELSKPEKMRDVAISLQYVSAVFKKDSVLREKKKEELLSDLRQIEKFLEEYKNNVREQFKQISVAKDRSKLILYTVTIAQLKNVVATIAAAIKQGHVLGQDSVHSGLLWVKYLLEEEQWRKNTQIMLELTQSFQGKISTG